MSYTVLARRYRSATFDELIGQEHIAQTLKKAIDSGRIAHAYLFCGTRGTGKTSTARILAKCLNCEKSKAPTSEPCGKCNSCEAIARGDDIDVIEIDAASNTGVDNVRDLIANASYRPARSRFKVYIIDEVHMLSKQAFNALLKTMEEPPEHVKFILATTEPEKVLPTILSRCQRYDFRNIPTREIADHLKDICKQEKIKADEDALLLIAKAGAGSMRDSLSLLDRLLSVGEKELTADMIEQLLGLPKTQLIFDLAQAIGEAKTKDVLSRADKMIISGLSPDTLIASLVDHLRNLLVLRTCGPESNLVEVPGLAVKDLAAQAERFNPIVLTQDIAILEELRRQLRSSQAGRALLDATLVRLALAEQFNQIGDLLAGGGSSSAAAGTTTSAPALKKKFDEPVTASETAAPLAPVLSAAPAAVADDEDDDLPAPGKVWETSGPSLAELLKQRQASEPAVAPVAPPAPETNVEPVSVRDLPDVWQKLLDALAARGPALLSLVSQGNLASIEDGRAIIRYEKKHETFVKLLDRNGKKDVVSDALTRIVGEPLGVKFEIDATSTSSEQSSVAVMEAPPAVRAPVRREVPQRSFEKDAQTSSPAAIPPAPVVNTVRVTPELVEKLRESEPLIKTLMDELGATIVKVEPPENSTTTATAAEAKVS